MTALCFIDTETTSLRHDRRAWEIGIVRREVDAAGRAEATVHHWLVCTQDLDLGNADPMSLKIGRFYARHPEANDRNNHGGGIVGSEVEALSAVEQATRGAHLVGNVVSFDAEVLAARMRANGICPSWHYHLIDIESMAVGYLHSARDGMVVDPDIPPLPWDSERLSSAIGVRPPSEEERHTALGDAQWVMRMWDAIVGGRQ